MNFYGTNPGKGEISDRLRGGIVKNILRGGIELNTPQGGTEKSTPQGGIELNDRLSRVMASQKVRSPSLSSFHEKHYALYIKLFNLAIRNFELTFYGFIKSEALDFCAETKEMKYEKESTV